MKKTVLFSSILLAAVAGGYAQGTAFTYQGRLLDGANPANGLYELQFTIYDADTEGRVIGQPLRTRETPVSNGLFTVTLDFRENLFTGGERWMEIALATGGEFSPLRPRQRITATPYAQTAGSLTGPIAISQLPAAVALLNGNQTFTGVSTFDANVGIGTAAPSAKLTVAEGDVRLISNTFHSEGFEGTTFPPASWTTDSFSPWTRTTDDFFEGSAAASHTAANFASSSLNTSFNFPTDGFVTFDWKLNLGLFDSMYFFVDNAVSNYVQRSVGWTHVKVPVSAGVHALQWYHEVFRDDTGRVWLDNVGFTDRHGNLFVDGKVEAESLRVERQAEFAGGKLRVGAGRRSEDFGSIPQQLVHLEVPSGYGEGMRIDSASPGHAPAIYLNHTGLNGHTFRLASFGDNVNPGSFRIFDDTHHVDRLVIDADGKISGNGAGLTSLAAGNITGAFTANVVIAPPSALSFGATARQMINLYNSEYGIGVQTSTIYHRSDGGFAWFNRGVHSNNQFDPGTGGTELMRLNGSGGLHLSGSGSELSLQNREVAGYVQSPGAGERWVLYSRNEGGLGRLFIWSGGDKASIDTAGNLRTAGAINPPSDRNVKRDFQSVDTRSVLEKLIAIPIQTWHYTNDHRARHLGPVAQDFHTAFGLGSDDKHIATVDADGVALAAIQGLNQKVENLKAENAELKERLARLERSISSRTSIK